MAQVLVGYDKTGSIQQFDEDGNLAEGTKLKETIFLSFSRLLVKDEIKRGSFSMTLGVTGSHTDPFGETIEIKDQGAASEYRINSPVGEYGILYATGSGAHPMIATASAGVLSSDTGLTTFAPCGLIYYQAGVVVLSGSVFTRVANGGILSNTVISGSDEFDFGESDGGFTFTDAYRLLLFGKNLEEFVCISSYYNYSDNF